jgi:hypothetical protein
MKRWFVSLVVILLLSAPSWAQVTIDKKHRVANFGPGYCAWCSIETLGRHHQIEALYDLAENRSKESSVRQWNPDKGRWVSLPYVMVSHGPNYQGPWVQERRNVGTDWGIYYKLKELGIKNRMQWTGNKDTAIIRYAMRNKLGCCFAVKEGCFGRGSSAHAMILTNYTDKTVEYIDPNDPKHVYEAKREWFDYWWTGWILVIEKQ